MNLAEEPQAERRRMSLLAPLMVAGNAFLLLCMAVLGIVGMNGGESLGLIPLQAAMPTSRSSGITLPQRVPG